MERDNNGRFVDGNSGGPGRPCKEETLTEILRLKVDKEAIAEKLIAIGMEKDDVAALKYIYDRVDGKPKESIEYKQIEPKPLVVEKDD